MRSFSFLFALCLILLTCDVAFSQAENVPVGNPIYPFLKRMELKGLIGPYHDAVLPLSRREIAAYLTEIRARTDELTGVERDMLDDFFVEFEFDLQGSLEQANTFFGGTDRPVGTRVSSLFTTESEKHLYTYTDSNLTMFVDGLGTLDARRSTGDALGGENAQFLQFGGRIRGTIYDRVGYYLQLTNAQFWGSRDVLRRDRQIRQAYTLDVLNAQNFDFVEGYARYDAGILGLQVGRERLVWGDGYGDKLILSENPRVFDFIRADAQYKALKYTFVHGWILGKKSYLDVILLSDTSARFFEPVVSDKYVAAHRIEVSFPQLFDFGFQEVAIYSNRSADLAYLNPVTLIESAQRSREERDNILWAFDIQTHFLKNIELHGTLFLDDLNFALLGEDSWQNRYAIQGGIMAVDPLGLSNLSLAAEYTRIEPYTFSHGRSRDNDYGSLGFPLGHHIGPNAESWFLRAEYLFSRKLRSSLAYTIERAGENVYDQSGRLITNVGGDFLQPHRESDPEGKNFLGGNYVRTSFLSLFTTYEIVNEIFFDLRYTYQNRDAVTQGVSTKDHDFGVALRVDF